MALSSINSSFGLHRSVSEARELLSDLQRQLATQKKSTTYGGLGTNRTQILSFRGELAQLEGYRSTALNVSTRLEAVQLTLNQIHKLTVDTRSDALSNDFSIDGGGQTSFQALAKGRFLDIASMLNTSVGDQYVFGGRITDSAPLPSGQAILDGDGDQAGFRQIVDERLQADVGLSGRGRLSITLSGATTSFSEDSAGHPFGLKLNNVSANTLGVGVSGPSGSPANVDFTFSSQPSPGSSIVITLDLPDGTKTNFTLQATTATPTEPGEFQVGADLNETSTHFNSALTAKVRDTVRNELRTASLFVSADNFFDVTDTDTPQRVVGSPPGTATALVDATSADTVIYYQGEVSATSARDSAISKMDDSLTVSHGVRANEDAFRTVLKSFAMLAVETFDESKEEDVERYEAIRIRVGENLSFKNGAQSVQYIATEIVVAQAAINNSDDRHAQTEILLEGLVFEVEHADPNEVGVQILALSARIEASLAVTASIQQLSILQFL